MQTLRDANAKATETEKKRSDLSRTETQLSGQLVNLQKEIQDLKARQLQQVAQFKNAQSRIASLETANHSLEQKLEDAATEVELARKSCREHQFRIKQLQEEIVFLEKRKRSSESAQQPDTAAEKTNEQCKSPPKPKSHDNDGGIPSWMK